MLVQSYPVAYKGAFIDTHLFDLFKRLQYMGYDRICYMEDVVFEHLHYRTGKSEYDDTYKKRVRFADDKTFIALAKSRQQDSQKLRCAILCEPIPKSEPRDFIDLQNLGLFKTIIALTRLLLFDRGLPLRWRSFLWYWFIGSYLADCGLFGIFVKR